VSDCRTSQPRRPAIGSWPSCWAPCDGHGASATAHRPIEPQQATTTNATSRLIAITRVTHTLTRCLLLLNRAGDTHDLVTTSDTSTKERSPLQWAMRSIHSATNGRASATRKMKAVFITASSTSKRRRSRRYQLVDRDDVYVTSVRAGLTSRRSGMSHARLACCSGAQVHNQRSALP